MSSEEVSMIMNKLAVLETHVLNIKEDIEGLPRRVTRLETILAVVGGATPLIIAAVGLYLHYGK